MFKSELRAIDESPELICWKIYALKNLLAQNLPFKNDFSANNCFKRFNRCQLGRRKVKEVFFEDNEIGRHSGTKWICLAETRQGLSVCRYCIFKADSLFGMPTLWRGMTVEVLARDCGMKPEKRVGAFDRGI